MSKRNKMTDTLHEYIKSAMDELEKFDLFQKSETDFVRTTLENTVTTELKLIKAIRDLGNDPTIQRVENTLSGSIGEDRVQLIKGAFSIETYRMRMKKHDKENWSVEFRRGESKFRENINLASINEIAIAEIFQWASFVIEVFMFVFSCIGIRCDLSTSEMKAITTDVVEIISHKEGKLLNALNSFKKEWINGGIWKRAKAIFWFLKESYSGGFFWKIANLLIKTMSAWKEFKAVLECTAMLVAAFATEGVALIARIVLSISSAVSVVQKIINLDNFDEFKKTQIKETSN